MRSASVHESTNAGGIGDEEALLVGERVPARRLRLEPGPVHRAVQTDDERRRPRAIVRLRHVEQVLAHTPVDDHGTAGLVVQRVVRHRRAAEEDQRRDIEPGRAQEQPEHALHG